MSRRLNIDSAGFAVIISISCLLSIVGCSAESEEFRLNCIEPSRPALGDILLVDIGAREFKQLTGSRLTLPILDNTKTDSQINLTLDPSPMRELAKTEGNEHRFDGLTYVAHINRATLDLSLQRYKNGEPYKKPQLKAKCRLIENKI